MLYGPGLYEWLSHNAFVIAMIIAVIAVMIYFAYTANKKRGRYRQ
ncbi:EYxxD motif small membrane protein [Brevibacillus sp. TJ4]